MVRRSRELDLDGVVFDGGDAFDRFEVGKDLAAGVPVEDALEALRDRLGVHWGAVGELGRSVEGEGVREPILGDLPRLGEQRLHFAVVVELHEGFIDVVEQDERRAGAVDGDHVHACRLTGGTDFQDLALRRTAFWARAGDDHERGERHGDDAEKTTKTHVQISEGDERSSLTTLSAPKRITARREISCVVAENHAAVAAAALQRVKWYRIQASMSHPRPSAGLSTRCRCHTSGGMIVRRCSRNWAACSTSS